MPHAADACPALVSGAARKRKTRRFTSRRRILLGVAICVPLVGTAALVLVRGLRRHGPAAIGGDGSPAAVGDAADARGRLAAATERDPRDANAWLRLALFDREQRIAPEVCIEEARRATALDPNWSAAWVFLAEEELRSGRIDAGVAAAQAACRGAADGERAFRVLGELLLRRNPPDPARAIDAFRRARIDATADPQGAVLLAEAWIRELGELPASEGPPEMRAALAAAAAALDGPAYGNPGVGRRVLMPVSSAWVALVTGRPAAAIAEAAAALKSLPADLTNCSAELHAVRGRALAALGRRDDATAEFRAALASRPLWTTVLEVLGAPGVADDEAAQAALLDDAALANDSTGALHAARALRRLSVRRVSEASSDAEAAVRAAPGESAYSLLLGDVRRAGRDRAAALAAYREAERLAPSDTAPLVHRAFAVLDASCGGPAARGDIDALTRELDAHSTSPDAAGAALCAASGAARLALGRRDEARACLERAATIAPFRADVWLLVGDAWSVSPLAEDQDRAAEAYAHVAQLRPDDAQAACCEARARLDGGDASAALALCNAVLARRVDRAALALRARALGELRRWGEAQIDLARLSESEPDDAATLLRWMEACCRAGDVATARHIAQTRAAGLPPDARGRLDALQRAFLRPAGDVAAASEAATLVDAEIRLREGDAAGCARIARSRLAANGRDVRALALLAMSLCESADALDSRVEIVAALGRCGDAAGPADRALVEGCADFAGGDCKSAAARLASALGAFRDDPRLRQLLAAAMMRSGDVDGGLRELRVAAASAAASDAMRLDAAQQLRAVARDARDASVAERLLREARGLAPASPELVDDLCVVLLRRGAAEEAAREAEQALGSARPDDAARLRLRYRAAHARLVAGQLDKAAEHLAALPEAERTSAQALTLRGVLDLRAGRPEAAMDELEKAWRADPDDSVAFVACLDAALRCDRVDAAKRLVDERRAARPDDTRISAALALLFANRGRFDEARAFAREACARAPADLAVARLAVSVEGRAGDAAAAVTLARALAKSAPDSTRLDARLLLGETLEQFAGLHDEARAIAESVVGDSAAPESARRAAKVLFAETRLAVDDGGGATEWAASVLKDLERVGSAAPTDRALESRCRFVLGSAALLRKDATAAQEQLALCLALDPDHAAANNNMAWSLSKTSKDASHALDLARRATMLAPSQPDFWDTRGVCAAAAGQAAEAETSWRRAVECYAKTRPTATRARAASALRLAAFLLAAGRADEARTLAAQVLSMHVGAEIDVEARRLAESK